MSKHFTIVSIWPNSQNFHFSICSSPKCYKAAYEQNCKILAVKYLILKEITNFLFPNFSLYDRREQCNTAHATGVASCCVYGEVYHAWIFMIVNDLPSHTRLFTCSTMQFILHWMYLGLAIYLTLPISGTHWDCIDSWRWYSEVSRYCRCDTWSYSVCYICGGCGDCHCCMPHHCWLQTIQKEVVSCQSTEWTTWAGGDQHGVTGRHDAWTDER